MKPSSQDLVKNETIKSRLEDGKGIHSHFWDWVQIFRPAYQYETCMCPRDNLYVWERERKLEQLAQCTFSSHSETS